MKTAERFIKKQVTVEAIQFNGNSNRAGIELFVGKELKTELESETAYIAGHGAPIFSLLIETKEGVMKAFKNDWIIKEPFPTGDRDFYPCKSDIFEKTYSPLASHPSPMSAEQVEELADKYASEEFDKHSFSEFKGAENSLWENRKADFIAGYNAATTPSVKADVVKTPHPDKPFIVANVRDIIEGFEMRGDYSYSRMTEMFNDATFQWMGKQELVKADGWVRFEDKKPDTGKLILVSWPSDITPEIRRLTEDDLKDDWSDMKWIYIPEWLPAPPKQQ